MRKTYLHVDEVPHGIGLELRYDSAATASASVGRKRHSHRHPMHPSGSSHGSWRSGSGGAGWRQWRSGVAAASSGGGALDDVVDLLEEVLVNRHLPAFDNAKTRHKCKQVAQREETSWVQWHPFVGAVASVSPVSSWVCGTMWTLILPSL